jgi:hypothetical protein
VPVSSVNGHYVHACILQSLHTLYDIGSDANSSAYTKAAKLVLASKRLVFSL